MCFWVDLGVFGVHLGNFCVDLGGSGADSGGSGADLYGSKLNRWSWSWGGSRSCEHQGRKSYRGTQGMIFVDIYT